MSCFRNVQTTNHNPSPVSSKILDDKKNGSESNVLGNCDSYNVTSNQSMKRETRKKPEGKPKRPLSAYNLFFKLERDRIVNGLFNSTNDKNNNNNNSSVAKSNSLEKVRSHSEHLFTRDEIKRIAPCYYSTTKKRTNRKSHGKIAFADLARTIGMKWKNLDNNTRQLFEELAREEKNRYQMELVAWKGTQNQKVDQNDAPIHHQTDKSKPAPIRLFEQNEKSQNIQCNSLIPDKMPGGKNLTMESEQEIFDDEKYLFELHQNDNFDLCDSNDYQDLFDDESSPSANMKHRNRSKNMHVGNQTTQNSASFHDSDPTNVQQHRLFNHVLSLPCENTLSLSSNDRHQIYRDNVHLEQIMNDERFLKDRKNMYETQCVSLPFLDQIMQQQQAEDKQSSFKNSNEILRHNFNAFTQSKNNDEMDKLEALLNHNSTSSTLDGIDLALGCKNTRNPLHNMNPSCISNPSLDIHKSRSSDASLYGNPSLNDIERMNNAYNTKMMLYYKNNGMQSYKRSTPILEAGIVAGSTGNFQRRQYLEQGHCNYLGLKQEPIPNNNNDNNNIKLQHNYNYDERSNIYNANFDLEDINDDLCCDTKVKYVGYG